MNYKFSPILRLTAWYVLIIMIVSIMFSTIIYQLTISQIRSSLPPRARMFQEFDDRGWPQFDERISEYLENKYQLATQRLRLWLVILNSVVLGGSSLASYYLAKRTLRPIEQALDEQRKFTADASHELRTPLTAMKTEIEVGLLNSNSDGHARILRSNLEEIAKLEALSTSLLKLARHETERQEVKMSVIEFEPVMRESFQRVQAFADKKKIVLAESDMSGTVLGDHASLTDLFVILLDNAIKYSPEKSELRVRGAWAKSHVAVTVSDQGIGIPAADLTNVFRRFYRSDVSRSKDKIDGYGLGLSIAQQIVERHNGTISIASQEGKGTTATVTLLRK
jgi:signal transduction histidine kinase